MERFFDGVQGMKHFATLTIIALAFVLSGFFAKPQQLGWLAQKQINARLSAAQILRDRYEDTSSR